jgi:hypothetical protein
LQTEKPMQDFPTDPNKLFLPSTYLYNLHFA